MIAFFNVGLFLIFVITLAWPLNVPLVALAYKVRLGHEEIPLETQSFWWRSTFAALGLAGLSGVFLAAVGLMVMADVPKSLGDTFAVVVPAVLFLAYVPLASWFLFWMYAFEELYEGLSVFCLMILIPALPLLLAGWLYGFTRIAGALARTLGLPAS